MNKFNLDVAIVVIIVGILGWINARYFVLLEKKEREEREDDGS